MKIIKTLKGKERMTADGTRVVSQIAAIDAGEEVLLAFKCSLVHAPHHKLWRKGEEWDTRDDMFIRERVKRECWKEEWERFAREMLG